MSPLLQGLSQQLMTTQLAIYRAEWDLEVDDTADKMATAMEMVKQQITFHVLCSQPELGGLPAGTGDALVDEMRRLHAHAKGISQEMVQNTAGAALQCLQAWHMARGANDYSHVRAAHETVIMLQRQLAGIKAANLSELYGRTVTPYEAMIDAYDPGRTLDFIKHTFGAVGNVCQELLKHASEPKPFTNVAIDEVRQAEFCYDVMVSMGYDATPPRGKLGVSTHPLCRRVGPNEVWLTNRYDKHDFTSGMMNIIHEGGHGRYYQSLPQNQAHDWLGGVAGETVNEGMALLSEQVIGRSSEFCQWLAPRIAAHFAIPCAPADLHKDLTAITRDYIRADAREVIYPLHLQLRVDVEEQLINNAMPPAELPKYWKAQSTKILGITPPDDRTGCLQDIHPYVGYIGYFPCYLLGFMAAAQIGDAMKRAHPDIASDWTQGDFSRTNRWLNDTIYSHGRNWTPDQLIEKASGAVLSPQSLIAHLRERYGNR